MCDCASMADLFLLNKFNDQAHYLFEKLFSIRKQGPVLKYWIKF